METSDDPVTAAVVTTAIVSTAEASRSSGGGHGISVPSGEVDTETTKQEAEGMMAETQEGKKLKKRAAASILTKDWPLNLGIPGLLGRLGG